MTNVALVTCLQLPEPDPDEALLREGLRQAGLNVEMMAWDDPLADPARYDLCVLHSCWNYYERPQAFLEWINAAAASTRLMNPAGAVRWNIHKSYLKRLQESGVSIIPTVWIGRGEKSDLGELMRTNGWNDVVIKPAISASSYRTKRFGIDRIDEGNAFLDALVHDLDVLVQRYMPAVESSGERSVVWINGEFTHAVRKEPRFAGGIQQVSGPLPVSDREREIGTLALSSVGERLLYARVDIMNDSEGNPVVSELELMEPALFLQESPVALQRLVDGIRAICSFDAETIGS